MTDGGLGAELSLEPCLIAKGFVFMCTLSLLASLFKNGCGDTAIPRIVSDRIKGVVLV